MKAISKIKYIIPAVFVVFFMSTNVYSASKTSNNYAYVQINQMNNISSELRDTSWVPNSEDANIKDQTNIKLTFGMFEPAFMSNFIVGFMWKGDYGVELEYASYDMFTDKVDGRKAGNSDGVFSNIRIEYVFFNFRQDFWEYKDVNAFYKVGFGFVQPNFGSAGNSGGSNLEYGIQGSVGGYYPFNDFIDLEVSYKILGNYARRRDLYAASYEKKTKFVESSINWGVRFKLHSYSRKDMSVY